MEKYTQFCDKIPIDINLERVVQAIKPDKLPHIRFQYAKLQIFSLSKQLPKFRFALSKFGKNSRQHSYIFYVKIHVAWNLIAIAESNRDISEIPHTSVSFFVSFRFLFASILTDTLIDTISTSTRTCARMSNSLIGINVNTFFVPYFLFQNVCRLNGICLCKSYWPRMRMLLSMLKMNECISVWWNRFFFFSSDKQESISRFYV